MNDPRPIGIFDSGLGGLTVLQEIRRLLPNEEIIYFGDTARVPYGDKSSETILRYAHENANFLLSHDIKMLVVACNTASAYALESLEEVISIPVLGVIDPGVEGACKNTQNRQIAILATTATIRSGVYQEKLSSQMPESELYPIACPLLVPLVEEGLISSPITTEVIEGYLEPIRESDVDTILLGCTHYPLLRDVIQSVVGEGVSIVDSASTCAEHVTARLKSEGLESGRLGEGEVKYFASDNLETFLERSQAFLRSPIHAV